MNFKILEKRFYPQGSSLPRRPSIVISAWHLSSVIEIPYSRCLSKSKAFAKWVMTLDPSAEHGLLDVWPRYHYKRTFARNCACPNTFCNPPEWRQIYILTNDRSSLFEYQTRIELNEGNYTCIFLWNVDSSVGLPDSRKLKFVQGLAYCSHRKQNKFSILRNK